MPNTHILIPLASTTGLHIGADRFGTAASTFRGQIDEVAIWNRTLSATDMSELYNGGNGVNLAPIPEPNSLALLGLGALGMIGYRRRRR